MPAIAEYNHWLVDKFMLGIGSLIGQPHLKVLIARVAGAPLTHPLGVGGSLEVVGVDWLAHPTSLTVAFAGLFAGIGTAEALASAVARIPFEQPARMQSPG